MTSEPDCFRLRPATIGFFALLFLFLGDARDFAAISRQLSASFVDLFLRLYPTADLVSQA